MLRPIIKGGEPVKKVPICLSFQYGIGVYRLLFQRGYLIKNYKRTSDGFDTIAISGWLGVEYYLRLLFHPEAHLVEVYELKLLTAVEKLAQLPFSL